MNKDELQSLANAGMSQTDIGIYYGKSRGTIRRWMDKMGVIPAGKINKNFPGYKFCPRCKVDKTLDRFYTRKSRSGYSGFCKDCNSEYRMERQRKFKKECVEYKGGECIACGYDRCQGAMDFHHKDPKTKKFGIAKRRSLIFDQEVIDELDKCMLLCATCHREIHAGYHKI